MSWADVYPNLSAVTRSSDCNPILVHPWSLLSVIHFTKKEPGLSFPFTPYSLFLCRKVCHKKTITVMLQEAHKIALRI